MRILEPLGLIEMRALTPGEPAADIVRPRTESDKPPGDPTHPGAAGPIAETADAMTDFWETLIASRQVSSDTLEIMFDPAYPMFDDTSFYGLGVIILDISQPDGDTAT